jgi:hypothetical protein
MSKDPKNVTFYGRLSYPTFTAQEAYDRSLKGSYPAKDVGSAAPDFLLLVNDTQFKKVLDHCVGVFLPYCQAQHEAGEKRDALDPKEVKQLIESIQGDLADQVFNSPFKLVSDKTAELAPEAVAAVKIIGPKGGDFELKAIVNDESELAVPDPDLLSFPVLKPLGSTTHEIYPGCVVAVTANLYAYKNGKLPGFSAGANVAVFRADADRFGGGAGIDTDEIFLD